MSLHSSSSVNGEGSTPKDPLYKILDELRSLKLQKEKQETKEKGKKEWKKESVSQKRSDLMGADLGKNGEKVMKSAKPPLSELGTTLRRLKVMAVPVIKEKGSQQRCEGTQEGDGNREKFAKEE